MREQEEKRMVRPGEWYRRFDNKRYQIVTVAAHWETGEAMVVYQQLSEDFRVYVLPYERFVSQVDREKHPEVQQKYQFERIRDGYMPEPGKAPVHEEHVGEEEGADKSSGESDPNPALLRFLAAETLGERMACLKELALTASQSDLDSVYLVLDMKQESGTIKEQVDAISRTLALQQRYDGARLR